jgi:hypothetical protein
MTEENDNEADPGFDSRRRLCPDGTCVGVIGPDGKCSECGRSASGEPIGETIADEPLATVTDAEPDDEPMAEYSPTANDDAFDPNRRLCSDDACIGVVGSEGRCNVCGKPA